MTAFFSIAKELVQKLYDDDCPGLAAEMAFSLVLASGPALLFCLSIFSILGAEKSVINELMQYLYTLVPWHAAQFLKNVISEIISGGSGELALVSLASVLWVVSNGAVSIIKALRRAYSTTGHYPTRRLNFVKSRTLAFLIIFSLGFALFLSANLLFWGNGAIEFLTLHYQIQDFSPLLQSLRLAVVFLLVMLLTSYVYRIVPGHPDITLSWRQAFVGSIVFVVLWISLSIGFSYYVEQFGRYNQVYGAIGTMIILMIWVYLSSLVFLIGGELNAILDRREILSKKQKPHQEITN